MAGHLSERAALMDRVVHHAESITIQGKSYRRRIAEAKQKSPRTASHCVSMVGPDCRGFSSPPTASGGVENRIEVNCAANRYGVAQVVAGWRAIPMVVARFTGPGSGPAWHDGSRRHAVRRSMTTRRCAIRRKARIVRSACASKSSLRLIVFAAALVPDWLARHPSSSHHRFDEVVRLLIRDKADPSKGGV